MGTEKLYFEDKKLVKCINTIKFDALETPKLKNVYWLPNNNIGVIDT